MSLSETQKKKLQDLAEMRDPSLKLQRYLTEQMMASAVNKLAVMKGDKGDQGDQGYTPVKGVDYFIEEEITAIINYIQTTLINFKEGKKGDQGEQGNQGEKGDQGKGKAGKNGETPIRGIDYWTKQDIEKIQNDIKKLIPKVDVTPKIDVQKIVDEALKNHSYKNLKDAPDLTDLPKLIEFLKRGGFRGGGGSSSSSFGAGYQTATGTVNGTNKVFVFAVAPNSIVADGSSLRKQASDGTANWTGTTTVTLLVAPNFDIYGVS